MPINKSLKGDWQEAFAKDSDLVQWAREDYFKINYPHFDCETSFDLSGLFWEMILSVSLLDSKIYKIQEAWTRQEDLQYANDVLKTSPKGLQFFHPISPTESPKVMGLEGIHHLDAICHFAGVTFCPCCGKEGQNKGTIINHLQMKHYKLGLLCEKCLWCPTITLEAIQHHSWGCKQPKEEDRGPSDISTSDQTTLPIPFSQKTIHPGDSNVSTSRWSHCRTLML